MRRRSTTAASVASALSVMAPAIAAAEVRVSAEPATISTTLGRDFGLRTTITNTGAAPTSSVLAHLNVLSLREDVYLDPEDWSAERTRYLGAIPAGASMTVEWKLKAVNPGSVAAFVSVLPQAGSTETPTNGPTVAIAVARRQTLNSDGILPLALGIPAAIAALGAGVHRRRTRRSAENDRDASPRESA